MTPKPTVQKRPRGAGSISPVWSDAGWRFKARFPNGDGTDRGVGTFPTEDAAHGALNALAIVRADGGAPIGSALVFDYGERWIDRLPDKNRDNWRSTWGSVVRRAPFADWALESVKRADIKEWVASLHLLISERTGKPISRQTCKHALGLVRRMYGNAIDRELVLVNPCAGVKLPRKTEAHVDTWTRLSLDEVDLVLNQPWIDPKPKSAYATAIYTGLREGELAALCWENIDLGDVAPHLWALGSWDGSTKNEKPRRVSLIPLARAALLEWWEHCKRPKRGLVWSSNRKGRMHAEGYDWGWSDTIELTKGVCRLGWRRRAGIARAVRFHDLRHTNASHLVSGSWGRVWTLQEVRDQLGHSTIEVTQRYARFAPGQLDAAAADTVQNPSGFRPAPDSANQAKHAESLRRAMRDSNARPMAPEAKASASRLADSGPADGWRTSAAELVVRIANREPVSVDEVRAVVAVAMVETVSAGEGVLGAEGALVFARFLDFADRAGVMRESIPARRQETA